MFVRDRRSADTVDRIYRTLTDSDSLDPERLRPSWSASKHSGGLG